MRVSQHRNVSRVPSHLRLAARRLLPQGFVAPMLATFARVVPEGEQWAHEIKHDGYRMLCRRDGDRVRIFSRNALDWTDRVPAIVEALRLLPIASATIDGEAVVWDAKGVTDFDALRAALSKRHASRGVFLYAFDLIELDGRDLRQEPWVARRTALAGLLSEAEPGLRLSEHLESHGPAMFKRACALGLEGIVSKRPDAPYKSGRSPHWLKVKNPDAPAVKRIAEIEWT
jgi:bifunctional non-homologous end joining protein LigD